MLKNLFLSLTLPFFLLAFIEGTSSFVLFVRGYFAPLPPPTMDYDAEIGWVGKPHLTADNAYGPGTVLKTNSLGLRMEEEISDTLPKEKKRVICSGDSFTAGDGVSNGQEWCSQLGQIDPKIERINLGQSGYSIDQAFLLFNRLKTKLPHHHHVFAVTGLDFERLTHPMFNERYKPILGWQDGVFKNLISPVPKNAFVNRRLANFISGGGLKTLKVVELAQRALPKKTDRAIASNPEADELKAIPIALEVFTALQEEAKKNGQKLTVVYLPTYYDFYFGRHKELRQALLTKLPAAHIPYVDLTQALSTVPVQQIVEGGAGHYTARVHALVAKEILKFL